MDFNSNRQNVDHLISLVRSLPAQRAKLQEDFDNKRISRIQKAVSTRPLYIPLQFDLKAAGKPGAYSETTGKSNYNVVILGFMTNNATRAVSVRKPDNNQNFSYVGSDVDLRLTLNELAGVSNFAGDGQRGVFYLPAPIFVKINDRLTIDVFKTDNTVDPETLKIVLIGYQIFEAGYGESLLSNDQQELMNGNLDTQVTPEIRFLKHQVNFVNNVARGVETPPTDEPLLIRGVRSTFNNSLIEVGLKNEPKWTITEIPVWAFAGYEASQNYRWFERPVFLPQGIPLQMNLTNATGDDADAPNGTFTWLCETV